MRPLFEESDGAEITKDAFRKRVRRLHNLHRDGRITEVKFILNQIQALGDEVAYDVEHPTSENATAPKVSINYAEKPYYYNEHTDHYVFHMKSYPKPVVVSGDDLALIKERYSNWDDMPSSINEISREFIIPRKVLVEILRKMGWTHDSDPYMDAELALKSESELVDETLLRKRRNVLQKIEQKNWDSIKQDASKFRELEITVVKPLMEAMNKRQGDYQRMRPNIIIKSESKRSGVSVVLPIMDIHMGKLPFYVRGEYSYSQFHNECKIALEGILSKIMSVCTPDQIVTIVGSDWFHVDNIKNSTSELTPQSGQMIGNYWDVVVRGYDLAFEMFDAIVDVGCPVYGYEVDGNHDRLMSLNLSLALEQRYRHEKDVSFSTSPDNRKYHVYGKNLFSFLHGDYMKQQSSSRQNSILTNIHNDTKRLKINTLDIENYVVFSGHVHKKSMNFDERSGILDVVVPSLSTTDLWHHNNSYEGNRRAVSAFLYSEDSKDMDILSFNLDRG